MSILLSLLVALGVGVPYPEPVNGHENCVLIIGDTTLALCPDGYVTTS